MDIRKLVPKDILAEEDKLVEEFLNTTDENADWEVFCAQNASKRYLDWVKKENETYEKNLKKGLIIN